MSTPSIPRFRFFAAGLVVFVLFGLAHLIGHLAGTPAPADADEATLLRLMTDIRRPPVNRSMMELLEGFSLFLILAPWTLAAVGFALRPLARANAAAMRRVVVCYTLGCAAFTAVSVRYWFFAPTSFLALGLVFFALSLAVDGRSRPAAVPV